MSPENLWGKLPQVDKLRTPLVILREQGALLGEGTERMLEGEVNVRKSEVDSFLAEMYIVAPSLGGYRAALLVIEHGIDFYPVKVYDILAKPPPFNCRDEEAYLLALKKIFQSQSVLKLITSLLTQMKSVA